MGESILIVFAQPRFSGTMGFRRLAGIVSFLFVLGAGGNSERGQFRGRFGI